MLEMKRERKREENRHYPISVVHVVLISPRIEGALLENNIILTFPNREKCFINAHRLYLRNGGACTLTLLIRQICPLLIRKDSVCFLFQFSSLGRSVAKVAIYYIRNFLY
jgi:hypothetical protein